MFGKRTKVAPLPTNNDTQDVQQPTQSTNSSGLEKLLPELGSDEPRPPADTTDKKSSLESRSASNPVGSLTVAELEAVTALFKSSTEPSAIIQKWAETARDDPRELHEYLEDWLVYMVQGPCTVHPTSSVCRCNVPCRMQVSATFLVDGEDIDLEDERDSILAVNRIAFCLGVKSKNVVLTQTRVQLRDRKPRSTLARNSLKMMSAGNATAMHRSPVGLHRRVIRASVRVGDRETLRKIESQPWGQNILYIKGRKRVLFPEPQVKSKGWYLHDDEVLLPMTLCTTLFTSPNKRRTWDMRLQHQSLSDILIETDTIIPDEPAFDLLETRIDEMESKGFVHEPMSPPPSSTDSDDDGASDHDETHFPSLPSLSGDDLLEKKFNKIETVVCYIDGTGVFLHDSDEGQALGASLARVFTVPREDITISEVEVTVQEPGTLLSSMRRFSDTSSESSDDASPAEKKLDQLHHHERLSAFSNGSTTNLRGTVIQAKVKMRRTTYDALEINSMKPFYVLMPDTPGLKRRIWFKAQLTSPGLWSQYEDGAIVPSTVVAQSFTHPKSGMEWQIAVHHGRQVIETVIQTVHKLREQELAKNRPDIVFKMKSLLDVYALVFAATRLLRKRAKYYIPATSDELCTANVERVCEQESTHKWMKVTQGQQHDSRGNKRIISEADKLEIRQAHVVQNDMQGVNDGSMFLSIDQVFNKFGGCGRLPEVVMLSVGIKEVMNVDELAGSFTIRLAVNMSWYDTDYDIQEWFDQKQRKVFSYRVPYLTFVDVVEGDHAVGSPDHCAEVTLRPNKHDPMGMVTYESTITTTLRHDFVIRNFPFDRQELIVALKMPESSKVDSDDHARVLLPNDVRITAAHDLMKWKYHLPRVQLVSKRGDEQHMIIFLRLSRRPFFYVMNVGVIMWLIASLASSAFLVPINIVAERAAISLTLLLTTVAFKLLLADMIPQVHYLTLLDVYVLVCFLKIFMIAAENALAGMAYGIEDTAWNQNTETFLLQKDTDSVLYFEELFCYILNAFWISFNLLAIVTGLYLRNRNNKAFGPPIDVEKIQEMSENEQNKRLETEDVPPTFSSSIRGKLLWARVRDIVKASSLKSSLRAPEPEVNKQTRMKCSCMECLRRRNGYTTSAQEEVADFEALIVNAGLFHERSHLLPVLYGAGLTANRITELEDATVWDYLNSKHVSNDSCMKLVSSAKRQVDVLYIQGSASYLMQELDLDGKLCKKTFVIDEVNKKLNELCSQAIATGLDLETSDIKQELNDTLHPDLKNKVFKDLAVLEAVRRRLGVTGAMDKVDFNFFCNLLVAKMMLSSSATPSTYLFAKRECVAKNGNTLYTQLWAGYTASTAEHYFETHPDATQVNLVIVDVGKGQLKPYVCTCDRGQGFRLVEELPKDMNAATEIKNALEISNTILSNLERANPGSKRRGGKSALSQDDLRSLIDEPLRLMTNALKGTVHKASLYNDDLPNAEVLVHFIATSAVRTFLSDPNTRSSESTRIKSFLVDELEGRITEHFQSLHPNIKHDDVQFLNLTQEEEAMYEYKAIRNALDYAVDIPVELQGGNVLTIGNLAWGRGSAQGWIYGEENGTCRYRPLALQVGLSDSQEILMSEFHANAGAWNLEVLAKVNGRVPFALIPSRGYVDAMSTAAGNMTPAYPVIRHTIEKLKAKVLMKASWIQFNKIAK